MKLSKEEVQHIAQLARLGLTDKEIDIYGSQLSQVLDYVEQLQEVDTSGVEPTAQVTGLKNVWHADKVTNWEKDEIKKSLEQSPELKDGQIKVKKIL